jgi:hypothetical protein
MAITVLPRALPSGAASFAGGLGQGLSSGIESLIDMKLKDMRKQQQAKQVSESLTPYLGKAQAEALGSLSVENPQLASVMLKEALEGPGKQLYSEAITGQRVPSPMAMEQPGLVPGMPPMAGAEPGITPEPAGAPAIAEPQVPQPAPIQPKPVQAKPVPMTKATMAEKLASDIERMKTYLPSVNRKDVPKLQAQINNKEAQLSKIIINEERERNAKDRFEKKLDLQKDKMDLAKEKFAKEEAARGRKEEFQKQEKIDKEYKPLMKLINKKAEAALTDRARYLEMKRINEEGDLGSNAFNIFTDALEHGLFGLGVNLTSLQTADAQAMKKLSKDFVKNVKEIIGTARITQAEVMLYLSTIPNLMQSPEGRARIIETNLELIKLADSKQKVASDIVAKNKNKIPDNFDTKILNKMRPKLEKFENNILNVAKKAKQNIKVQQKQAEQTTFKDVAAYGTRNIPTPRSTGVMGYLEDILNYGSRNL